MESLKRRFIYTEGPPIVPIVDIYYGTGTTTGVTSSDIITKFSTATGFIGSPAGRTYTFGPTFGTYRYWAIPDLPNTGERVVSNCKLIDDITVVGLEPSQIDFYSYYQIDPTPPSQTIKYGKLDINGITYRLYRTSFKYGSSTTQLKIYSL